MKTLLQSLLLTLVLSCSGLATERPNVILIMVDDMGFSDLGYHGGEIDTPNLDELAYGGVRFSQFYNSGRCCPTRATLLTGLHPHQTGIGWMTQPPGNRRGEDGPPAYQGFINKQCVTIAKVLKEQGYATLMTGKWHLGINEEDQWPLQRGFEEFYGCLSGATRFFTPEHPRGMTSGNEHIDVPESTTDEAFYTTDAFTDHAIRFLEAERQGEGRPSFLYLAYTAPHWPLQAFEDDIAKYRGKYREGWEKLRETRHQRQIELGLIDPNWPISEPGDKIPAWNSLDEKKQDEMDLKMAVYAAMVDRVDQNIGKLRNYLKESGMEENTLILFLSDNGACQEGGMLGRGEFYDIDRRNQQDNNSYGEAWANAGSTPFRLYKHFAHEGGTATPFFMHWPTQIEATEEWFTEPAQLIDIMPTILDVAGATYPEKAHGNDIPALDGRSLRPAFDGEPLGRKEPLFVEHEDNAFVRDGDWKLVGRGVSAPGGVQKDKWELYNMAEDRAETQNLASTLPERVNTMAAQWDAWAKRVGVYPKRTPGQTTTTHEPPIPVDDTPSVGNRPFNVSVTVRHPRPQGVVLSHGGLRLGYALHFKQGRPAFSLRSDGKLSELVAKDPVKGKVTVDVSVTAEAITISVDGKEVARKKGMLISAQPGLGLYLEQSSPDPVGNFKAPNAFNGKLISWDVQAVDSQVTMRTEWGEAVTADNVWQEYPRPQLQREAWTNLNGNWDYAITSEDQTGPPSLWDGEILVPFAVEAPLSGVEKRLRTDQALWYHRTMGAVTEKGTRTLLNFEAVDYHSTLWVNGTEIGSNVGGNLPFSFDITDAIEEGENTLLLRVTDDTDARGAYQLHGKQRLDPKGIWYTPVSGIWQTVWMEQVPEASLSAVKVDTTMNGTVTVGLTGTGTTPEKISLKASLNDKVVATAEGTGSTFTLEVEQPQLWSPDSPTLYDLEIQYGDDLVQSYFGIREVGQERDEDGHLRFTLNGERIFHWGTLDQGWWPDGLLTPPSDEAMLYDIEFLQEAGFNTIRKHIKVEPRRYYWHCDRLGMMLWQDQVSSMSDNPEWTRLEPNPQTVTWPAEAHAQYMTELELMMDTLHSHPSIVQWVPFNERWGQHQTMKVGKWSVEKDPSRHINIASGGNFFPVGHIVDHHSYPDPDFPFDPARFSDYIRVVGEFGGHGFPVEGHVWDPRTRNWGYGGLPENKEEWEERYRNSLGILMDLKEKGIAAGIYTQTTDVEGEINGLITYDRKVKKLSAEALREMVEQAGLLEN